ncbi:MAG: hypothetical protein JOZ64_16280 [Solirubrobacterales bacterium]|nr:hypothetical protein [Solirubrobacterales bacterium]
MTESSPTQSPTGLRPGDQAPPGSEDVGENLCPACSGSGKANDGSKCITCAGTGRVIEGMGGA